MRIVKYLLIIAVVLVIVVAVVLCGAYVFHSINADQGNGYPAPK